MAVHTAIGFMVFGTAAFYWALLTKALGRPELVTVLRIGMACLALIFWFGRRNVSA